ncbi:cysteine-rich receptor-like protein kinase 10 [Triticum aestivum]|uniref:cysteine-rich receptor-like protein kinase 10 n=1 Tax=Triticum aestivum TaxID=4565 RepID=UPI001D010ECB|nr:cysteine-rich receptor-like protein kinase 10 [Triticum aestivum]
MVGVMPCLLLLLFVEPRAVAAAYSEYSCNVTTGNYTASDAFGANVARLTAELPINGSTSPSLYASAAIGTSSDKVFALALCRGDITDASTCSGCLDNAFQQLRALCAGERDATFYHDLCTLRYSGEDFLGRPEDNSPVINAMDVNRSTFAAWDSGNATSRSFFLSLVGTLFGEMAMYGSYNSTVRRFASAVMYVNPQLPTVYGLAQCTPDLSPGQCWHCFQGLQEQTRQWYDGREGGRIIGIRCNIRYESYQFYDGMADVRIGLQGGSSSPTESNGSKHRKTLIILLCVSITVFCSVLVCCLLLMRRLRKGAGKEKTTHCKKISCFFSTPFNSSPAINIQFRKVKIRTST